MCLELMSELELDRDFVKAGLSGGKMPGMEDGVARGLVEEWPWGGSNDVDVGDFAGGIDGKPEAHGALLVFQDGLAWIVGEGLVAFTLAESELRDLRRRGRRRRRGAWGTGMTVAGGA